MKALKISNISILTILFIFLSTGCRYEEGPKVGFRSVKTRLEGKWVIESVANNDKDETANYKNSLVNYELDIAKDGNYSLKYRPFNVGNYNEEGVWVLSDDKKIVTFTQNKGGNPGAKSNWEIKRITHTEFWAQYTDGNGDKIYVKLKP